VKNPAKKILILTAMDIEHDAIRRAVRLRPAGSKKIGGVRVIEGTVAGNDVVLAKTGMGKKRIGALMDTLLDAYDVPLIIFAGVAGAVNESLKVGDVVVPASVRSLADGKRYEVARAAMRGIRTGSVPVKAGGTQYTVERVFGADDKARLFDEDPAAVAVDMESSCVCERAARRSIPCLIIRGISDTRDFRLPKIFFITRKNLRNVIKHFPAHPLDIVRFISLWRNCAIAAKNTALVVTLVLQDPDPVVHNGTAGEVH